MLVLNRHFGESIIIEGGVTITVLSAENRTVWLRVAGEKLSPSLLVGACCTSSVSMRLSIGAPLSMVIDEPGVRVQLAGQDHPSRRSQAVVSFYRTSGEEVLLSNGAVLRVKGTEHEHPNLVLSGDPLGGEISLAFIRPVGSWIRLGVDAPQRRVYRKELWEEIVASNSAALDEEDDLANFLPKESATL